MHKPYCCDECSHYDVLEAAQSGPKSISEVMKDKAMERVWDLAIAEDKERTAEDEERAIRSHRESTSTCEESEG